MFGRRSYADSRMRPCLFEGLAEGRALGAQASAWRCPVGTGRHSVGGGSTASGMAAWCRGWPHSARDGGEDVLCASRVTTAPGPCARRHPYTLRGCSHALLRGSPWEEDRSRQHSVLE
jgi:hypothetical protein